MLLMQEGTEKKKTSTLSVSDVYELQNFQET